MSKNAKATAKNGMHAESTRAAARAAAPFRPKGTVKLSNGIVLKVKPVSQAALRDVQMSIPKPEIPQWFNEDRGEAGEMEPNEADPAYIAAMEEYAGTVYLAVGKTAMLLGTECESVPPGMWRPEDEEWLEWLEVAGLRPDIGTRARRYLAWLEYHALTKGEDQSVATMAPLLAASLSEEEVDRVVESFRSRKGREADSASLAASEREDGSELASAVSGGGVGAGGEAGGAVGGSDVAGPAAGGTDRTAAEPLALPVEQSD